MIVAKSQTNKNINIRAMPTTAMPIIAYPQKADKPTVITDAKIEYELM